MRTMQPGLPIFQFGLGGAALAFLICVGAPLHAQLTIPNDPVEALQAVLKRQHREAELKMRRAELEKEARKIVTLGQMRRALSLQEWRDQDLENIGLVDQDVRREIGQRFQKKIQAVLANGDRISRLAAVQVIRDMGTSVRDPDSVSGFTRRFGPELAKLIQGDDLSVGVAAASALSRINPEPSVVASALSFVEGKFTRATTAERRAGARALGETIRSATQLSGGRAKTGVQTTPEEIVQIATTVVPIAQRGLTDPDAEVRRLCLEAIGAGGNAMGEQIQDPQTAEVNEIYRQEVEDERRLVLPLAEVLGKAAAPVARTLSDANGAVRLMAGQTLTDLGHAMHRLERRASSIQGQQPQNTGARLNAAGKELRAELAPLRPQAAAAAPLLAQGPADARPAMNPLRQGMIAALPELARVLEEEPNAPVRLAAAEALEMYGPGVAPVAEVLVRALQDPNRFVRWVAARTLGNANQRNVPGAVAGLARLLQDEDLDVRLAAAEALGDFEEAAAPAVPALITLVNQDDARMRQRAIQSLVEIGPRAAGAIPGLTQALRNKDHRVRRAAAEALGTFQDRARPAVPALLRAMDDPDPEVRKAASDALLSIE